MAVSIQLKLYHTFTVIVYNKFIYICKEVCNITASCVLIVNQCDYNRMIFICTRVLLKLFLEQYCAGCYILYMLHLSTC